MVALMALSGQGKPNTFTIGFNEKDYDESEYANMVAKKFNTNHNQVLLDPKVFLDDLRAGLDAMDSPSGDGINTYVVSKAIKKSGLIVALSGVGGDELFAGYPFFSQYLKLKKLAPFWNSTGVLRRMMAPVLASGKSARAERMRSILTAKENSIAGFYPEFRRIIPKSHLSHLIKCEKGFDTSLELQLKEAVSSIDRFPYLSQVSIAEYMGYTQQTLLRDTDQMGMAVSLEIREPFFDHDLISFILQIPDKWKLGNSPKKLLVESMGDLLPPGNCKQA
ncbi:MAG: asparagine synthase [Chitinophagaceae bacterium]|nr:asparagine synthase [Chitinophagaceae bacterium]